MLPVSSNSSPHGTKTWEIVRYLANKFLSDAQRKKIKNGMARLQRIPLKALGIEAVVAAQEAEIERLKSRIVILDGKLNLAMHGMPRIAEFEAYRLSAGLVNQLDLSDELGELVIRLQSGVAAHTSREGIEAITQKAKVSITDGLVIGASALLPWVETLPQARLVFCQPIADIARKAKVEFAGLPASTQERIELVSTSPLTALLAQGERRFGLIACFGVFQQLSSLEQIHFLDQASQRLTSGGILALRFPEASSDHYWMQPGNLRPISLRMVQEVLERLPGLFSVESVDGILTVSFRKG